MSYTKLFYHIIIRTKYSKDTINPSNEESLYKYINGYVQNKKSVLYKINGTANHIHLLVGLHPTITLSDFIRDLKTSTNKWIKSQQFFPNFTSWGKMYAAFTISYPEVENVTNYIDIQKSHHAKQSFKEEYRKLITEYGISIDENYFLNDE